MTTAELIQDIRHHRDLCREALALFASPAAVSPEDARKTLPARLDASLISLRRWRQWWREMSAAERQEHPEVAALLQDTLDLMMKAIVQGRETMERKTPAAPVTELAKPNFTRAEANHIHFVARRYTQHAD